MSETKSDKEEKVDQKEQELKGEPKEENEPQEENPKGNSEENDQVEDKQIFVKNIPYKTNDEQLREAFAKYGNVRKAEILKREYGRSTGNGIVEFEDIEDKKKVMQKEIVIDGRTLELKEMRLPRHIDYNKTVYVGNLLYETTEETLRKFFLDLCSIKGNFQINIIRNSYEKSKGYAYIYFENEDDAKLALSANGHELDKRTLTVEMKRMGPPRIRRGGRFSGNFGRRGGFRGSRRFDDYDRYYGGRSRSNGRRMDRDRSRSNGRRMERERSREREYERSRRRDSGRDRGDRYKDRERSDRFRDDRDRGDRDRRRMNMDRSQD